jgi:hypothetical protein
MSEEQPGFLRRTMKGLMKGEAELEAEDLQLVSGKFGGCPVKELPDRRSAVICGTLRTVTLRPRANVPALVGELYDGSGILTVVWLGRRQIPGIEPGRRLRVTGRVARREGKPVVFNPSYELLPATAGE